MLSRMILSSSPSSARMNGSPPSVLAQSPAKVIRWACLLQHSLYSHTVRDPVKPHRISAELLLTLHELSFSSCLLLLLLDWQQHQVGDCARLHSGLMSSHFCWTLASVSFASPKHVILAITNLKVLIALIKQSFSTTMSFNELCHTSLMLLTEKNCKPVLL